MMRSFAMLFLLLCITACLVKCSGAWGAECNIEWNANPETNITYEILIGTASNTYTKTIPVGNVTTATIPDLAPGVTYHISLRAVNALGLKSGNATEVTTVIDPLPSLDRTGWQVASVSSEETAREPTAAINAIDGNGLTFWHTVWEGLPPHYITIDMGRAATVSGLSYLPRLDNRLNGNIQSWELESSMDGETWTAWGSGTWPYNSDIKRESLPLREIRYFRLWGNENYCNACEINLTGSYNPEPPAMIRFSFQYGEDLGGWEDLPPIDRPKKQRGFVRWKIEELP